MAQKVNLRVDRCTTWLQDLQVNYLSGDPVDLSTSVVTLNVRKHVCWEFGCWGDCQVTQYVLPADDTGDITIDIQTDHTWRTASYTVTAVDAEQNTSRLFEGVLEVNR